MRISNELIKQHEGFVHSWALRYGLGYGIQQDDLVQEGRLGLLHAVKKFNPKKNVKFLSYAGYWVRQFMCTYIKKHCYWRTMQLRSVVMSLDASYTPKSNKIKSYKDVNEYLDINAYQQQSDFTKDVEDKDQIKKVLAKLRPKEREVIILRYGIESGNPMSNEAVAKMWGTSRQWTFFVYQRAMKKLKKFIDK